MKPESLSFIIYSLFIISCTNQSNKSDTFINNSDSITRTNTVYHTGVYIADEMPEFPNGGNRTMMKFISDNLQYPNEAKEQKKQGKVVVQCIINEDGTVTQTKILKGVHPSLDKEALRIISIMPKWSAGKLKGKTVAVKYAIPIIFKLAENETINHSTSNQIPINKSIKYDFNISKKEKLPENFIGMTVQMKTEKKVYLTNLQFITIIVDNPTDIPLSFGRSWEIQIWDNNKWTTPEIKKVLCWTDEALATQETFIRYYLTFPIGEFYKLKIGKYRILKTFYQNSDVVNLMSEFDIR